MGLLVSLLGGVAHLLGAFVPYDVQPPPSDTYYFLSETGDRFVSEANDPFVQEVAP